MNLVRRTLWSLALTAVCLPVVALGQSAAPQAPASVAGVRLAIQEGRVPEAVLMADSLVRRQPGSRDAAAVQIEARAAANETARAFAAYDRFANTGRRPRREAPRAVGASSVAGESSPTPKTRA